MPASSRSFFGKHGFDSPSHSPPHSEDPSSDDDSEHDDAASDSTLDDPETYFGHPLERIPRKADVQHGVLYNTHDSDQVNKLLGVAHHASNVSSRSSSRSASVLSFSSTMAFGSVYYEDVVDTLLESRPNLFDSKLPGSRDLVSYHGPASDKKAAQKPTLTPPILLQRLSRPSPLLSLLIDLNRPELRNDPWNACPHILQTVEKGDYAYLCMQPLWEFDDPPFLTVSNYIDFFRQMLEGLTFFHEQSLAGFRCNEASSYMVDLGSSPENPTVKGGASEPLGGAKWFDRSRYPVRYYFTNFSGIRRVEPTTTNGRGNEEPDNVSLPTFQTDVKEAGEFIERSLQAVPPIATKFRTLAKGMQSGSYSADGARRLFEALCTALEPRVFESAAIST